MTQASLTREQLEVLLEIRDPEQWEGEAAAWDYAVWDGPGDVNAWADPRMGYVDATCDIRGFIIERGRQTNWDHMVAANIELELDNSSGNYSIFGSESWPRIRPGFAIEVWAKWTLDGYWAPGLPGRGWLEPLVGTAQTSNAGPLLGETCIIWKMRGTDLHGSTLNNIAGQWGVGGQWSWALAIEGGYLRLYTTPDGGTVKTVDIVPSSVFANDVDTYVAVSIQLTDSTEVQPVLHEVASWATLDQPPFEPWSGNPLDYAHAHDVDFTYHRDAGNWADLGPGRIFPQRLGNATVTAFTSPDGLTWTPLAASIVTPAFAIFSSNQPVMIGKRDDPTHFAGRLYFVETRIGLDPAAGQVVWRFDPNEYDPETDDASFIDERNMTWDLTNQLAITFDPPGPPVWVDDDVQERWPLFVGTVSEYIEGQTPDDYKVSIQGHDAFYQLATPINIEYSPGAPYEPVHSRINGLLTKGGFNGPRSIRTGDQTMLNYATSRDILDEVQLTAMSAGGIFFIDNDGTAMYMGQERVFGRVRPEGVPVPSFTDSCDPGGLPYAAIEPIVADHEFGNIVIVTNVSQGTDSPRAARAEDRDSIIANGAQIWMPDQLVLCNANWVQPLADFQVARRAPAFYRINSFECYPVHDDRLWPTLLPMRIGDSLFISRTPPESVEIFSPMLCDGLRIEATPSMWKFVVRCSPGDSVEVTNFWDYDYWDAGSWV